MSGFFQHLRQVGGYRRDFSLALGTNLALMGLALVTGVLTARLLGPAGRGEFAAIQLWGMLLISLGSLGVPEALAYFTGRRPEAAGQLITSAWAVMLPLSVFWILLGYWLLPILLQKYSEQVIQAAQLFLLVLPMAYISSANMAHQGLRQFFSWGVFRLHKPFVYAVLLILLGLLGLATPYTLTLALIASSAVGPILVIYLIRRSAIRLSPPNLIQMRDMLSYGLRSVMGSVPEQLNVRLDQFVMVLFLSSTDLGLYVVAASWSLMFAPIVRTINIVTFSYVSSSRTKSDQLDLFASSLRISTWIILLANLGLLLATPVLLPLLYGPEFQAALGAAMILLIASGFYSFKLILSGGLRGLGYPEATAYAEILSLAATAVLLFVLLPPLGILGAAIASMLAYLLAVVVLLLFTLRNTSLTLRSMLALNSDDVALLRNNLRFRQ
jgi:O-antigen/teichoic acid export membrane protein